MSLSDYRKPFNYYLKVSCRELKTTKILNITESLSFSLVKEKTKEAFALTTDDFYFSYLDHVQDTITISTMNDFNVYVKYMLTTKTLDFDLIIKKLHDHNHQTIDCVQEKSTVNQSVTNAKEEQQPQFDIICNECCRSIKNNRWRCSTCDDFDICSTCKARVNHDPKHTLHYIEPEVRHSQNNGKSDTTEKSNSQPPHMDYMCDYCDAYIVGVRHRCSACPDFDLCHSCFGIVKENHPDHPFITYLVGTQAPREKINEQKKQQKQQQPQPQQKQQQQQQQQQNKSQSVVSEQWNITHYGVHCDNCNCLVKGIRYKCGHCPDFDLCESCEKTSNHDKTHILLKIQTPLQGDQRPSLLPSFQAVSDAKIPAEQAQPREPKLTQNQQQQPIVNPNSENNLSSGGSTKSLVKIESEKKLDATFISDLNIPDGTNVIPKKTFIKMWKLKNTGEVSWPKGSRLLFNEGDILRPYPMSHPDSCVVPSIEPNEEACILAELQAPDAIGHYTSYFGIAAPNGIRFGDIISCSIEVAEDPEPIDDETLHGPDNSMIFPRSFTYQTDTLSSMPSAYEPSFESVSVISSSERSTLSFAHSNNTHEYTLSPTDSTHSHHDQVINDSFSDDDFVIVEEENEDSEDDEGNNEEGVEESDNEEEEELVVEENEEHDEDDEDDDEEEDENEDISSSSNTILANDAPLGDEPFTTVYSPETECVTEDLQFLLQKVHEMGFSNCDEVVKELLDTYQGDMKKIIARLSEEEEFR